MFLNPHLNTVAPLRNVAALVELIDRAQNRGDGLPGMATFFGPSGYGKSTAAIYATNRFNACTVQVKSRWNADKLCISILRQLRVDPMRKVSDMIDQIAEELAKSGRPLIIDEADYLVSRGMIEIARDIYESSGAVIILVGEERFPQKLKTWDRIHGRQLDWVQAQPADLGEVSHMATIYAPNMKISDQQRDRLLTVSNRVHRYVASNLRKVSETGMLLGTATLEDKDWDRIDFNQGDAPAPRMF